MKIAVLKFGGTSVSTPETRGTSIAHVREAIERVPEVKKLYKEDERYHELLDFAIALEGLSRHSGVHAAGIVIEALVGARGQAGEPLAVVHARSEELARSVMSRLQNAWRLSAIEVQRPPHVLARVDKDGVSKAD